MKREPSEAPELLTPAEVVSLFCVDAKTVTRWAKTGRLHTLRTFGGHRRFLAAEVERLLTKSTVHRSDDAASGDDD